MTVLATVQFLRACVPQLSTVVPPDPDLHLHAVDEHGALLAVDLDGWLGVAGPKATGMRVVAADGPEVELLATARFRGDRLKPVRLRVGRDVRIEHAAAVVDRLAAAGMRTTEVALEAGPTQDWRPAVVVDEGDDWMFGAAWDAAAERGPAAPVTLIRWHAEGYEDFGLPEAEPLAQEWPGTPAWDSSSAVAISVSVAEETRVDLDPLLRQLHPGLSHGPFVAATGPFTDFALYDPVEAVLASARRLTGRAPGPVFVDLQVGPGPDLAQQADFLLGHLRACMPTANVQTR